MRRAWEAEAGGSLWVRSQTGLHSDFQGIRGYGERPCLKKQKAKVKGQGWAEESSAGQTMQPIHAPVSSPLKQLQYSSPQTPRDTCIATAYRISLSFTEENGV